MSDQPGKDQKINIELDEKTAEGTYSNLAIINHSVSEFIVDFIALMPGAPKAKVRSRIILTPEHAKRLHKALGDNIHDLNKQTGRSTCKSNRKFRLTLALQAKLNNNSQQQCWGFFYLEEKQTICLQNVSSLLKNSILSISQNTKIRPVVPFIL